MTKRGVLLRILMDRLAVDPSLGTFSDRLRLQKGVYLLQELGMPVRFAYGWYLRGPYSPSLTKAAFDEIVAATPEDEETYQAYSLSKEAEGIVQKLQALRDARPEPVSEEDWLELLASLHFYRHKAYFPPADASRRSNIEWLHKKLPVDKQQRFPLEQARTAVDALEKHGLW